MLTPFVICLREGIEIFLVIIPLVVYFNKSKMYEMSRSIFAGGALGAFLASVIGSALFFLTEQLQDQAGELFDGILGIVLSLLLLYSVVLLRKNKSFTLQPDQEKLTLSKKGIFLIAAITFFRELLEAVMFILTSSKNSPLIVAGASLAGLIGAALIVYIVTKGISKLNINVVFYLLNLFLIGLGAYYFGDGLDVLFGKYISEIFKVGLLAYAVPSYIIIIKKDLKKYSNSIK